MCICQIFERNYLKVNKDSYVICNILNVPIDHSVMKQSTQINTYFKSMPYILSVKIVYFFFHYNFSITKMYITNINM